MNTELTLTDWLSVHKNEDRWNLPIQQRQCNIFPLSHSLIKVKHVAGQTLPHSCSLLQARNYGVYRGPKLIETSLSRSIISKISSQLANRLLKLNNAALNSVLKYICQSFSLRVTSWVNNSLIMNCNTM